MKEKEIEYLPLPCNSDDIVLKINEIIRILNTKSNFFGRNINNY